MSLLADHPAEELLVHHWLNQNHWLWSYRVAV